MEGGQMADWKDWSEGWLKEGYYISYLRDSVQYYEHILKRDLAHWEYTWEEVIAAHVESGPTVPALLEITQGYDKVTNATHIWQIIFGIKGQVYIYIELPTDLHRHGIPKIPKTSATFHAVSHFEEWMSPFKEPSFITEHFMMRPECDRIAFSAYNPESISLRPVLNFFIAKMVTERIGTVSAGVLTPTSDRWRETLDKLYKRMIPHRPITLLPVRMPAEAPSGV
jgi:hypothetical protein